MEKSENIEKSTSVGRPTSARFNSVSHIFSQYFGDKFIRDAIDSDKIRFLRTSRGSKDSYQDKLVSDLIEIDEERRQHAQHSMHLENSILMAQAQAKVTEERELSRFRDRADNLIQNDVINGTLMASSSTICVPTKSYLRDCLDSRLLQQNGLLAPLDVVKKTPPFVQPPKPRDLVSSPSQTSLGSSRKRNGLLSVPRSRSVSSVKVGELESEDDTKAFSIASQSRCDSECLEEITKIPQKAPADKNRTTTQSKIRLPPLFRSQQPKSEKAFVGDWREQLNEDAREENRKELAILFAKVNHMKNPRFFLPWDPAGNGTLLQKSFENQNKELFIISPNPIKFNKYEVGHVFEIRLDVRNITSAMRAVRVIPPQTKYFSVGLGQFPGDHGLIAPGLGCQYAVRFSPDSLGDYSDCILIETQDSEYTQVVPIVAQRKRPRLNVPLIWDVGHCLVDGQKTVEWRVTNRGGPGRFVLVPEDNWPITNFQSATRLGALIMEPFLVWPEYFQLKENETTLLMIVFAPYQIGLYEKKFHILCDNCHMRTFTLRGTCELASLELVHVDGGKEDWLPGEIHDVTAQCKIHFPDSPPYTIAEKNILIRNKCNVDIPFAWKTVKPLYGEEDDSHDQAQMVHHRIIDTNSPFSVSQSSGLIGAGAEHSFTILFAPTEVNRFISSLHLIMKHIPEVMESPNNNLNGSGMPLEGMSSPKRSVYLTDVPELELEIRGSCTPLKVRLEPPAIVVPGKILVNTPVRRQVQLINLSSCPVNFYWKEPDTDTEEEKSKSLLEVQPRYGSIGEINSSWQCALLDVCITGTKVGPIRADLCCQIDHLSEPVYLPIEALVKGPELVLESSSIDFGMIRLHETVSRSMVIHNVDSTACSWTIHVPHDDLELMDELTFSNIHGNIAALDKTMIHLTFCPIRPRNVFFELELHTEYGDNKCFQIRAIVQQPRVVLKKSVLVPPDLYWNMTSNYQITLINQSAIAAMFEWQQPFGNSSDWVDVQVISSLRGEIAPQSEMQVDLAITPRQLMTIEELFLPCTVENQSDPVLLSVLGRVNDLQVNYTLVSSNDAEDMSHRVTLQENSSIDFGEKVPLHSVQKRVLLLQNSSAIPTTFHIFVEHFSAPKHLEALSPEEIDQLSHLPEALVGKKEVKRETREQNNHCETSLLAKTPNLADSRSKPAHLAHYDFCKRILNECKGAAFYCHPNKGELPPFSCVPVEIAAYNDMWGQYSDNLICAVGHLPPVNFKMSLGVVGCPIEFTMTAGQTDRQPIMRFGCRTAGSDSITRPIRLKNKSPFEIRVDWRIFEMQSNDRKLLDLNVEFGNVFELLDKDGNEVPQGFRLETPPAPPEAESLSRAPSDSLDSESIHNSIPAIVPDDMEDTDLDTFRSDLDIAINFHQANHIFALPQRPKVVHLFIRPHEGHPRKPGVVDDSETQESFTLQPKQLRIPAESYAYLHATFHPIASPHPLTFNCYALGFLSIDNFRAFTPGKVSRGEHYFVEPLRLDLRANIEEPGLEILDDEEEAQDFVLGGSFSELLSTEPVGSGKEGIRITHFLNPNKAITKKCCGIIRNYKETNLSFQLLCPAPFKLLKPRNDSRCRSTRLGEEMDSSGLSQELLIHLKPREICPLEITFDINGTLLPMLQNAPFHDPDQIQPVYWHKKFGNEKELCIRDAITVRFSNNKCQYRSIYAKIAFPTFELTKTKCEFGTCFISQCREMHLEIKNNTTSDCIWSVRRENIIGDDEIIRLEPTNGFLEGYQGALSKNKQLLKVFFTPKSGEFYEVRFIFNGVMGEEPCELIVTGNGSFDGQYHVIYNE